jgi:hypothetical protein
MAKKTKRKVAQVKAPVSAVEEIKSPETSSVAARSSFSRRTVATPVEFNPDYSYVVHDLKRIGVLAGTFFVILIALSFIIK